jgi:hypothetical protein
MKAARSSWAGLKTMTHDLNFQVEFLHRPRAPWVDRQCTSMWCRAARFAHARDEGAHFVSRNEFKESGHLQHIQVYVQFGIVQAPSYL